MSSCDLCGARLRSDLTCPKDPYRKLPTDNRLTACEVCDHMGWSFKTFNQRALPGRKGLFAVVYSRAAVIRSRKRRDVSQQA